MPEVAENGTLEKRGGAGRLESERRTSSES